MKRQSSSAAAAHPPPEDLYQQVTSKIIACLEKGTVPWQKTWVQHGLPKNFHTGHYYQGINLLLLSMNGFELPWYLTFKQAMSLGGSIRKGEKSSLVVYYEPLLMDSNHKRVTADQATTIDPDELRRSWVLRSHRVFNIEQTEGISYDRPEQGSQHAVIESCELVIAGMKRPPTISHQKGHSPCYYPRRDTIELPPIREYVSAQAYYAVLFHELVHSTGHVSRLQRKGIAEVTRFGDEVYSQEELVAELGASYLCTKCRIDSSELVENSASYLHSWIKALKGDKRLIFSASTQAIQAVEYILGNSGIS
jgi:antirestriction protein ArdC